MADVPSSRKMKKIEEEEKDADEHTQSYLEEASMVQKDLENVAKCMMNKILTVVQEFDGLKRPLYNKRHSALSSVPHFWAIAFMNHPKLKLLVDTSVEDCFNYLSYVQVLDNENLRTGYQVVFAFHSNPYFYNTELIKHNSYDNGVVSSRNTNIEWKENMNLSTDRKRNGKKRSPPVENFFDWLQSCNSNKHDIVCDIIKDDLWADPLKYFFLPDDNCEDNSESESEDDDYDDLLDSNDEESHDEETTESEDNRKQNNVD
ncbi:PREDICTED: NAP1-related protein 2 [Nicrophorus vespilloides]|uniref:NAP1-related protein 2 n=1 Tax=Nicrophorus vespilloides TaxID=110193 RepID=A0ABM1N2G2_NICVS|nr:PREDICTED: NAP1-related protein 2 [Nicrophorus vespilloides]